MERIRAQLRARDTVSGLEALAAVAASNASSTAASGGGGGSTGTETTAGVTAGGCLGRASSAGHPATPLGSASDLQGLASLLQNVRLFVS